MTEFGISILFNEEQPMKVKKSILSNEAGCSNIISVNDEQLVNADCSILLTEDGIVIFNKDVQDENARSQIILTDDGLKNLTVLSEEHSLNAYLGILVNPEGIAICVNDEQEQKTKLPIDLTEGGIRKLFNDLHPLNAHSPIDSNNKGFCNETSLRNSKFLNKWLSIEVTEAGIDIFFNFVQPFINDEFNVVIEDGK